MLLKMIKTGFFRIGQHPRLLEEVGDVYSSFPFKIAIVNG
jgi:hypothetical protein